ncbi:hypothetical protein ASG43_14340 [Aureimonas sp. Leaf454]|uniref:TadE/TadG family type IV pilus assembly protein n=1 Tax=Aureimonas sp. Leaf454 TaxID=1736381 RepID=UPI0007003BFD|nr:TadE/TadG family type IV pilus assembly protein [Aureimonas sp. Leaf454]KQT44508.1 hypothetical protein ASG43_14340 [Aureimonas sp. Leaf454]
MRPASAARRRLRLFARDQDGVGAVEFALVAPLLILLYLGGSELSMFLTLSRKVEHASSTINDLVTQSSQLEKADFEGIFNVARAIVTPYDVGPLGITATSVAIDENGKQKVDWSYASANSQALAKGSTYLLPAAFAKERSRKILVVRTRYSYVPIAGTAIMAPRDIGSVSYLNPRVGSEVKCPSC